VAALFFQVVGFGFDDARRQPQAADAMPDDLAQQLARQLGRVAVEEGVGQRRAGRSQAGHLRRSVRRSVFR
jgi:hypothetical protein